jgi:magnesium chelatase family protein
MMDRFDLRVEVPPVAYTDLDLPASGDTSATVAARVAAARARQAVRFQGHATARVNADLEGSLLDEAASPDAEGRVSGAGGGTLWPLGTRLSPGLAGGAHDC